MTMSGDIGNFQSDWRKRITNSPEAKQAKINLEFHRRKIRQIQEELTQASVWEKELEKRLHNIEEKVKPPLLKFSEQIEDTGTVEESIVEESIMEEDSEKLIGLLRRKAIAMDKLNRSQLLGFLKTVLNVRNKFLEKDNNHGVDVMQEMASSVLKHMGRITINWVEMSSWEAEFVRQLVREVEQVPVFIARIMDQFLVNHINQPSDHRISTVNNNSQSVRNQNNSAMSNN